MDHRRHVGFAIRTLSNLVKRNIDNSIEKRHIDNQTTMHGWVIGYLYDHRNSDIFQRDLEEEFSVRRSTATAILQLMEKNGLITRQAVACDARLKKLVLTTKAIEMHELIVKDIEQFEKRLIQGLSDEELNVFFATIEKMKMNLE